jgi:hypothetical protein
MMLSGGNDMEVCQYCTPEWLEESDRRYKLKPELEEQLKKLSIKLCYRVKAEPAWGIDEDIIFSTFFVNGDLTEIKFLDEESALNEADYVLAATPQEWKRLLRKEGKFVTDFVVGKVTLEHGSKVGVLGVAPHSGAVIDALTQVELQFPDEMSADELEQYRSKIKSFRKELSV